MSHRYAHPDGHYAAEAAAIGRELADRKRPSRREIDEDTEDQLAWDEAERIAAEELDDEWRERQPRGNGSQPKPATGHRTVCLTRASTIKPRPVCWLWLLRLAFGTLTLIGGREGIGKSILAYTLAALITRGQLEGASFGKPRAVIVAATEDSWEHTIVPRLMAAGADLDRVYRVDVSTSDIVETELSLPRDIAGLTRAITEVDAAFVILDPLISRMDANLDSHKDAEVRRALEPLASMAARTNATFAGLIHVNKSTSNDPLTTLMASRAFAAVARAVLFVMQDPEDETTRLLGQAKNNLGRTDLPTLAFRIVPQKVADTDEGQVWTGKLEWTGETTRTIREALEATADTPGDKTATTEAGEWLTDYLNSQGGVADSADIRREGQKAGHSKDAIRRAKNKLGILSQSSGFPRRAFWSLSAQYAQPSGETTTTAHTALTAHTGASVDAVDAVDAVVESLQRHAPTGLDGQPFHFDRRPT